MNSPHCMGSFRCRLCLLAELFTTCITHARLQLQQPQGSTRSMFHPTNSEDGGQYGQKEVRYQFNQAAAPHPTPGKLDSDFGPAPRNFPLGKSQHRPRNPGTFDLGYNRACRLLIFPGIRKTHIASEAFKGL
ncbi:hypothetical protein BS47DRAFT_133320 [Hydnum rufescens UP504]|uniref:Secreted protein n=1 Tax=Hydnum rufescens UP504 TaxID=1448309 RepID=A0A9P6APU2_9AGAM|nr:hypothetical protein BS47DRAFT_133320 [Hydnum rufescens UP504]